LREEVFEIDEVLKAHTCESLLQQVEEQKTLYLQKRYHLLLREDIFLNNREERILQVKEAAELGVYDDSDSDPELKYTPFRPSLAPYRTTTIQECRRWIAREQNLIQDILARRGFTDCPSIPLPTGDSVPSFYYLPETPDFIELPVTSTPPAPRV
jgi:hypothetical protein